MADDYVKRAFNMDARVKPGHDDEWRDALFLVQQFVALLGQPLELFVLLRDAIGVAVLVLGARNRCRHFNQLPDVVARNGDAPLELGERKSRGGAHDVVLKTKLWGH
jgi:hypothetical protein